MRNIYLVGMLLLFNKFSFLIQEEIYLNVVYEFTYARDIENKDDPYRTNMILSLGKHRSRYCPLLLYNENDPAQLEKQRKLQQAPPKGDIIVVTGYPGIRINNQGVLINEEIVKNSTENTITLNSELGSKVYKIESPIPKINWEIKNDKKLIGGYNCQKAIGDYGGRTYEAWFAPKLPFRDGPWKLWGLPGLILEAHDDKNEIHFTFKEISRNTDRSETVKSFLDSQFSITTNLKAYNRLKEEFGKDPEAVMRARYPNSKLGINNIDDPDSHSVKKIKEYNPMELSLSQTN